MKSKYFFEQFKDQVADEHKTLEAHLEEKELSTDKCDHKGRVSVVPGGLRCKCGAGWQGSQLNVLLDYFLR